MDGKSPEKFYRWQIKLATFLLGLLMIPQGYSQATQQEKPLNYTAYTGTVLDQESRKPVVFASVIITETFKGTVTNSEGHFLIKVPDSLRNRTVTISSLGYTSRSIPISKLNAFEDNLVLLKMAALPIEPVIIKNTDPRAIITDAIKRIPQNYGDQPALMTGFYRESIRKNRNNYKSVGEAILDIYKSPYKNRINNDRVKIYKGRKSEHFRGTDTIMMKFMGGPVTVSLLDVAKNPGDLLSQSAMQYYDYHMGGIVDIDGRPTYIIIFDQKDSVSVPLFRGKIYIDKASSAIVSVDFEISPKKIDKAAEYLILRKPARLEADVVSAHYLVKYRLRENLWYLNYVRLEDHFSIRWKNKLFRSEYFLTSETAITDIRPGVQEKIRLRESFKQRDFFSEKISNFEDPDFWGPANIIEPEVSIQEAIAKISKRLKRIRK